MGLIAGCRNGTLQQVYFWDVLIWQSVNRVGILFYIFILFYIRSDGKLVFETSLQAPEAPENSENKYN